jgi:hypothetical protein
MVDEQDEGKNKTGESTPANVRQKTVREVVVTHLDVPPPSGKQAIHPRRPAPVVPTREERTGEGLAEDTNAEKPNSE